MSPIRATDNIHLRELILEHVQHYGRECSLNHIDVSKITNFERTFQNLNFNGDISEWDVSNAFNMDSMFNYSTFDGDISSWNTSNVEQMGYMFAGSRFNQDISSWNVSKVSDMTSMFKESDFNGDISKWDVSRGRTRRAICLIRAHFKEISPHGTCLTSTTCNPCFEPVLSIQIFHDGTLRTLMIFGGCFMNL